MKQMLIAIGGPYGDHYIDLRYFLIMMGNGSYMALPITPDHYKELVAMYKCQPNTQIPLFEFSIVN